MSKATMREGGKGGKTSLASLSTAAAMRNRAAVAVASPEKRQGSVEVVWDDKEAQFP